MRRLTMLTGLTAVALLATPPLLAQSPSRLEGTWKLNLARSKYSPGPPPKASTVKWEAAAGGLKFTTDGVNAEGETTHTETFEASDGREGSVEGSQTPTTRALKRINDRTYEDVDRNNGKIMISRRLQVSRDGKTLTVTVKGVNNQGQPVNNVVVYEKQ
jgi:hypothetical protein